MDRLSNRSLTRLEIRVETAHLAVLTGFVEQSARAFGLGDAESLALTLAAEELLTYLARGEARGQTLRVDCEGRGYRVDLGFQLDASSLDLRWFNLTSRIDLDGDELASEIGLLIAARIVGRLTLSTSAGTLHLKLGKDKVYPAFQPPSSPPPAAAPAVTCRAPDAAELRLLLGALNARAAEPLPADLRQPERLSDMIAAGDYEASIAVDAMGRIGGGLVWRWSSERLVECLGPYLFDQPPATARLLLDHLLLGRLARSRGIGLLERHGAPAMPEGFFETLGTLTHFTPKGTQREVPIRYRHLEEDDGAVSWTHPRLRAFLEDTYDRLAFARDLQEIEDAGGQGSAHAVLAATLDQRVGEATLRPLWWGEDAPGILREHVQQLQGEGLPNILLELDLGYSWQARFAPAALDAGFHPRVILPHSGQGDRLILQHQVGP